MQRNYTESFEKGFNFKQKKNNHRYHVKLDFALFQFDMQPIVFKFIAVQF